MQEMQLLPLKNHRSVIVSFKSETLEGLKKKKPHNLSEKSGNLAGLRVHIYRFQQKMYTEYKCDHQPLNIKKNNPHTAGVD